MDKEYHTLHEGIPKGAPSIGMDTGRNREWLHLWIHASKRKSISVRLTRQDALNLIEEITHRLF